MCPSVLNTVKWNCSCFLLPSIHTLLYIENVNCIIFCFFYTTTELLVFPFAFLIRVGNSVTVFWENCSFFVSERAKVWFTRFLRESLSRFFLRSTWANRSWSLFCYDRPERRAHDCSFIQSDLSDSLTVALLKRTTEGRATGVIHSLA